MENAEQQSNLFAEYGATELWDLAQTKGGNEWMVDEFIITRLLWWMFQNYFDYVLATASGSFWGMMKIN